MAGARATTGGKTGATTGGRENGRLDGNGDRLRSFLLLLTILLPLHPAWSREERSRDLRAVRSRSRFGLGDLERDVGCDLLSLVSDDEVLALESIEGTDRTGMRSGCTEAVETGGMTRLLPRILYVKFILHISCTVYGITFGAYNPTFPFFISSSLSSITFTVSETVAAVFISLTLCFCTFLSFIFISVFFFFRDFTF
jgi:hypothetical protein